MFTTGAHDADYIWLAGRTDPDAKKHKGISILIVDTADPGFSWTPIITCDGAHHVNATYYADVRVPVGMRSERRTRAGGCTTQTSGSCWARLGLAPCMERVRSGAGDPAATAAGQRAASARSPRRAPACGSTSC